MASELAFQSHSCASPYLPILLKCTPICTPPRKPAPTQDLSGVELPPRTTVLSCSSAWSHASPCGPGGPAGQAGAGLGSRADECGWDS